MSVRVVVVVRSAGDGPRLDRAVASVRSQTMTEWVLVLAVPETEDAAAARLAEDDERVIVVRGTGRGALANAALAAAPGDLAVLHDDDGSWHPEFLARAVAHLDEHPDEVAVATRAEVVVDSGDPAQPGLAVRRVLAEEEPAVSLVGLVARNYVPPVSLLFRRTAHAAVGGYDETLPALEDWEFLLRLVASGPVGFLTDRPLAAWHRSAAEEATRDANAADESRLRDRFLRHDLAAAGGPSGLGGQLALAHQLRRLGRAHQDHLDAVTTDLRLELGRLRGELLVDRELLIELQEDFVVLSDHLRDAVARTEALVEQLHTERPAEPRPGLVRRVVRRARARRGS